MMKLFTKTPEPTIKPRLVSVVFVPLFLSGTKVVRMSLLQFALVSAYTGKMTWSFRLKQAAH